MSKTAFDHAREAMKSVEFFRDCYASSTPCQEHHKQVLKSLRTTAENVYSKGGQYGDKKVLVAFADALEIANNPGEYVSLVKP